MIKEDISYFMKSYTHIHKHIHICIYYISFVEGDLLPRFIHDIYHIADKCPRDSENDGNDDVWQHYHSSLQITLGRKDNY